MATLFGTRSRQVIFTSGATEAINAAIFGALGGFGAASGRPSGVEAHGRTAAGTVVAARIEHSAVREASERYGSRITEIAVDRTGRIDVDDLRESLREAEVVLVNCPARQP